MNCLDTTCHLLEEFKTILIWRTGTVAYCGGGAHCWLHSSSGSIRYSRFRSSRNLNPFNDSSGILNKSADAMPVGYAVQQTICLTVCCPHSAHCAVQSVLVGTLKFVVTGS